MYYYDVLSASLSMPAITKYPVAVVTAAVYSFGNVITTARRSASRCTTECPSVSGCDVSWTVFHVPPQSLLNLRPFSRFPKTGTSVTSPYDKV